ncbi:MAG: phosphonate C-P lyase system protein PhnH [Bacillota bacterium]
MTKVDQEKFDMIHGTQQIYRKLLDCMARPGKVQNIYNSIYMVEDIHGFSPALIGIAFTLIDREVNFHVIANQRIEVAQYLKWKTFSKHEDITNAPYILIQNQLEDHEINELMMQVNRGTLEDPHSSATIILNVKSFSEGKNLQFSGPGISGKRDCSIEGLSNAWIVERELANKEYPMGVDFILTTETGDMIAIPRTTLIESECL